MQYFLLLVHFFTLLLPLALYSKARDESEPVISHVQQDPIPERKIVILICSYNNPLEFTYECLMSALVQEYSNFEILFCDDCSPQSNIEQFHKCIIDKLDKQHRIKYIRNKQRYGSLGNQWHALHSINPDNIDDNRNIIVIHLDGDDVLLHRHVLKKVNIMHNHAWVTYGNFAYFPSLALHQGCCFQVPDHIIAENKWRQVPGFPLTHLRTFRLCLLKDLPLKTFLYHGKFYPAATDVPIMLSLCEKAGTHTAFSQYIVYGYRLHEHNELRCPEGREAAACRAYAEEQTPFQPLTELPQQLPAQHYKTSLIVFSDNSPDKLPILLNSIKKNISGLYSLIVLYHADEHSEQSYQNHKADFGEISFIRHSTDQNTDFKQSLLHVLDANPSDYLMFATDTTVVKEAISITECIKAVQKTHAYGFYLTVDPCNTPIVPINVTIGGTIVAWQFNTEFKQKSEEHLFDHFIMTLFSHHEINDALHSMSYQNRNALETQWKSYSNAISEKIGLCFMQSKVAALGQIENI